MKKSTLNRKIEGKVYCFTNNINLHKYVGITINPLNIRLNTHYGLRASGAPLLVKALVKYGKDNFTVKVIDTAKTIGELHKKEIYWIKKLKTKAPNGYNMTDGGFTNEGAIEANKEPILCITNGKRYDSIVEASEDTGISAYLIGFNCTGRQDSAGGMSFVYIDNKKKNKAKKRRKETKSKRKPLNKKVLDLKTGEIYSGINDASRQIGISRNMISLICAGKVQNLKGRDFVFLDKSLRKIAEIERMGRLNSTNKRIDFGGIICITTNEEFPSMSSAARKFGISVNTVSKQCRGGKIREELEFKFKKRR